MFTVGHNCVSGAENVHIDKRVGKRIREAMYGQYNQTELARALSVSPSLVSKWVRGERPVSVEDLERIARLTGKPVTYFFDDFEAVRLDPKLSQAIDTMDLSVLPVYGSVNAGNPNFVMDRPSDYVTLPKEVVGQARFAVRVRGDSMIGLDIYDGDLLFVRPQEDADDGDIVVARINGEEYTVKRLRKPLNDSAYLESANPDYGPITGEDLRIVGKVVGQFRER